MSSAYQSPLSPIGNSSTDPNYGPGANPYFTMANQFLPRNLHDIIRWSRYITMQSPVTTEVIRKLSTYPITEFIVGTKNNLTKKRYEEIFKSFNLKSTLHGIGFDYYTLGNVFLSMYFPIMRTLTCNKCNTPYAAKKADFAVFKNYEFTGKCPHCDHNGILKRTDSKSMDVADMNIIKWDPTNIVTNHNPITGESEFYYKIPNDVKRKIQTGDRLFVDSIPWNLVMAVKNNQDFKFDKNSIFHLKNNSSGHSVGGIAVPPLISLYALVFYQASLRKANESIAADFMNPMRVIYPTAQTGNSDPVASISMRNFVANMQDAIIKHRRDKSHVLVAPVPVGYQAVSGEGRNLLVSQEIQQAEDSILLSLGVSRELLSGVTNWTSSTVGLRLLENTMLTYTAQMLGFVNWVMSTTARYTKLEECEVTLVPFRLTDDDNLKQMLMQLVGTQSASMSSLFEAAGMDYDKELKKIKEDAIAKAINDIETKLEVDRASFLSSREAVDKFDNDNDYRSALAKAQEIAEQLVNADEGAKRQLLNQLKLSDYPMYLMVAKLLEEYQASAQHQQQVANEAGQVAGQLPQDTQSKMGDANSGQMDPNQQATQQQAASGPQQ